MHSISAWLLRSNNFKTFGPLALDAICIDIISQQLMWFVWLCHSYLQVVGAYFEKLGSKSFAVYSIAVTDADNKTWFVKRRHDFTCVFCKLIEAPKEYDVWCWPIASVCRYRNFERLHRQLKEIPNYSLHLPPKSFLSSSVDDYLVHQRCILLDKYLQVWFVY